MEKKQKEKENKLPENTLIGRIDLPTIFCDRVFVTVRETENKNKNYILSWAQRTMEPSFEQHIEQSRIMLTEEHLKKITDLLCNTLNYFPEKKENKAKKTDAATE